MPRTPDVARAKSAATLRAASIVAVQAVPRAQVSKMLPTTMSKDRQFVQSCIKALFNRVRSQI
jgi:hypothetical protein